MSDETIPKDEGAADVSKASPGLPPGFFREADEAAGPGGLLAAAGSAMMAGARLAPRTATEPRGAMSPEVAPAELIDISSYPPEMVAGVFGQIVNDQAKGWVRAGDLVIEQAQRWGKFSDAEMSAIEAATRNYFDSRSLLDPVPNTPANFAEHPAFTYFVSRDKQRARLLSKYGFESWMEGADAEFVEALAQIGITSREAFFERIAPVMPGPGGKLIRAVIGDDGKPVPAIRGADGRFIPDPAYNAVKALAPSPPPYGLDGYAHFASNIVSFGAVHALLATSKWRQQEDGGRMYVYEFSGANMYGRVNYGIIDPDTPEGVGVEVANGILNNFGPDTATLHLMLSAYAAESPDGTFSIPRQEVYKALGIHRDQRSEGRRNGKNRKSLTAEERDRMALQEIKNIQHLGFKVREIKSRLKPGKKGSPFEWKDSEVAHMWDVVVSRFGQGIMAEEGGQIVTTYSDWQLVGGAGLWRTKFLHGEGSLRQLGILSRAEFDKWATRSRYARALWICLQYRARIAGGRPVALTNQQIIEFAGGEPPGENGDNSPKARARTRDIQRNIKNEIGNALKEIEKDGWGVAEPRYSLDADQADDLVMGVGPVAATRPRESWPDFLSARAVFTPPPALAAKLLPVGERAEAHKGGDTKAIAAPRQAAPSEWYGSRVQELIKRLGISQAELAQRVGVQSPMVTYWKNGQRTVSATAAKRLDELERSLTNER